MILKLALPTVALALTASLAFAQGNPGAHMLEQWDIDADGAVTLEEARAKRGEIFYMFDIGNDGAMSAEDWAGVTEHMAAEEGGNGKGAGRGPGAAMHAAMTPDFNDGDGDGTVTQAEFEAATERLFALLDKSGDGIVTVADFGRP